MPAPLDSDFLQWLQDRAISFHERVYAVVRLVPMGSVTTYGDVGAVMGGPRLARQVGWALAALRDDATAEDHVPWHRVINARGAISHRGDFARGQEQLERLEAEGVFFGPDGRCDLPALRWPFRELLDQLG